VSLSRKALKKHKDTLLIAATGAGKTVMLSDVIQGYNSALVLQHRTELVNQNSATFNGVTGKAFGTVNADTKNFSEPYTFAMVQSLANHLEQLKKVDLLVIDEAHHAVANQFANIIEHCKQLNPKLHVFGVTATPVRADKKPLKNIFSNISHEVSITELIKLGYLVKPRCFSISNDGQDALKQTLDYSDEKVEELLDTRVVNDSVIKHWQEKAHDRPTVVFTSTGKHAKDVCEAFVQAGIKAGYITATMSDKNRAAVLASYDAGDIQVLVNVSIATEGFDHQPTSCVILLRACSDKSTMIQMVGRGLRIVDPERYPGVIKDDCLVLDFGVSLITHGSLDADVSLDGKDSLELTDPVKQCMCCGSPIPYGMSQCGLCGYEEPKREGTGNHKAELSEFVLTELDIFNQSPFKYETLFNGTALVANGFNAWVCAVSVNDKWHAFGGSKKKGIQLLAQGEKTICLSRCDDFLRLYGDKTAAKKTKRWINEPCTSKQRQQLKLSPTDFSVTKYRATCLMTWKWNNRAMQLKLKGVTP
jgi:superfamily II DNA or RNA helicase